MTKHGRVHKVQTIMIELLNIMQDVDALYHFRNLDAYELRQLWYFTGYLSEVYGPPYSDTIDEFMAYVSHNMYTVMPPSKRQRS